MVSKLPKKKFELTTFFKSKPGRTTTFITRKGAITAAKKFHKKRTTFILDKVVRTPKGGLTGRAIIRRRASKFGLGKNIGKLN